MGLDLSWKEEDKKRFGNCGKDLDTLVLIHLPESSGNMNGGITSSPERSSTYVLNDPNIRHVQELNLPENEKSYAIEYTEMDLPLTRDQVAERLRIKYDIQIPKNETNRDAKIEELVKHKINPNNMMGIFGIGTKFTLGMMIKDAQAWVSQKRFVRWVSKEEYEQKISEIKQREDNEEAYSFNRWDFGLTYEEKDAKCSTCPLSTYLGQRSNPVVDNPVVDNLKKKLNRTNILGKRKILKDIHSQLVRNKNGRYAKGEFRKLAETESIYFSGLVSFLREKLSNFPDLEKIRQKFQLEYIGVGKSREGCHRGSSYGHFETFFDFISQHGNFEVINSKYLNSDDGIPAKLIGKAKEELVKSRGLLEKVLVPAMKVFDNDGNLMYEVSHDDGFMHGDTMRGYGIGFDGKVNGIAIEHKSPNIFSLPVEVRRATLDEGGLNAIMALSHSIAEATPRFYFTEIRREGNTFYGTTLNGNLVELPPIQDNPNNKGGQTPFSGLHNSELVGRVEYNEVPAMKSFQYLQRLLEKQVQIAETFGIMIEGR